MQHCDPDTLALAALEPDTFTDNDRSHIHDCAICRSEFESFCDTVAVGRRGPIDLMEPPAETWGVIAAATKSPETPRLRALPGGADADAAETKDVDSPGKSKRGWLPLAAAAMIGAVVGGAAMTGIATNGSTPIAQPSTGSVVASTALAPLADGRETTSSGNATVEVSDDEAKLEVATAGLEDTDGYYEVWLIDPETMQMFSIGSISAGDQDSVLPIPSGVDLDKYSLVDISDEPLNGDPTHSKVSVLRGQLPA